MEATLPQLLAPYNQTRIAEHVAVTRSTVHSWFHDETSPSADKLPALAEILRIDLGTLTNIVAQDSKRRNESRASIAGAA